MISGLPDFSSLPTYEIEIGVVSTNSKRKDKVRIGLTNAELMFIHENGSPLRHIPARPVLQMTIDYTNSTLLKPTIDKCIDRFLATGNPADVEDELKKLCIKMENYAREIIYSNDGRLAPNSPAVAARKKGNHPLFDTGQLARSITCHLVKR
jgi:hypothetical protein